MANKNNKDYFSLSIYNFGNYYVYCPLFSKTGYKFTNEESKQFYFYSSRFAIAASVGILAGALLKKWQYGIGAAVIMFTALEISFRNTVLNHLPKIENFNKGGRTSLVDFINSKVSKQQLYVPAFLLLALTVIIPINARQNYTGTTLYINYGAAAVTFMAFILFVLCIIRHKEN